MATTRKARAEAAGPAAADETKAAGKSKAARKPGAGSKEATSKKNAEAVVGLRLKELIERVEAATGTKRKDLKPAVEAILTEIGAALQRGESFNLPGLGRGRVTRQAEKDGATMLTVKLKRGGAKNPASATKEPLAEDGEDG